MDATSLGWLQLAGYSVCHEVEPCPLFSTLKANALEQLKWPGKEGLTPF
jgi:hypothetical protein